MSRRRIIPYAMPKGTPSMRTEGEKAPSFSLEDQDGTRTTLESLLGKPLVLYFYPKDDTPGCTREACAFRDARADYVEAGARVVGVSPDAPASHRKFVDKYELNFPLRKASPNPLCRCTGARGLLPFGVLLNR